MMCKYAVLHSSLPQENKHWPSVDITFNVLCTMGSNYFFSVKLLVRGDFLTSKQLLSYFIHTNVCAKNLMLHTDEGFFFTLSKSRPLTQHMWPDY